MLLDSRTCPLRGVFVNADTNQPVRWVRWYDTETGEYERFLVSPETARANGLPLEAVTVRGRARLRFLPSGQAERPAPARLAPPSPAGRRPHGTRLLLVPGRPPPECDEPRCHAPAIWGVADAQQDEPEPGPDGRYYGQAHLTGRRVYCDKHFRFPTMTSLRGVTKELTEVVQP